MNNYFKLFFQNDNLKLFSAVWALAVIAPLICSTGSLAFVGLPWKTELAMSLILCVFLLIRLAASPQNIGSKLFSSDILKFIVIPFFGFIIWSGISAFWAQSVPAVVHHTLLWSSYLIFFLFIYRIVADKKFLKCSIISLGSVISIVSLCCIFEFVFEEKIGEIFGFRYGRYAEIFAALIPLFFAFTLRLKGKRLLWAILTTLVLWLGLLLAMSRGSLLSAVLGLSFFILFRLFSGLSKIEKKRLPLAAAALIVVVLLLQIPFTSANNGQKGITLSRISISVNQDETNSLSRNIRFLYSGVAKEMFSAHYAVGVGADNFGLEFNKFRAVFSANSENSQIANFQEDRMPQRAHNEYLQILAELGITGAVLILLLFYGIFKLGCAELNKSRGKSGDILTHAAVAGTVAFLFSSLFSSFSFRLAQNGIVFFFLAAVILRNYATAEKMGNLNVRFIPPRLKFALTSAALIACISLTVFSALKASSEFFVYQAESQADFETAETYYQKALALDPANASAHQSYGLRLIERGSNRAASNQFRQSVDKGINATISYSCLISSQILENEIPSAIQTNVEAIEIFPYSVFLRVRYASLLKKLGRDLESAEHFEIAARINKKQADTWRLFLDSGGSAVSREAIANKEILSVAELKPDQAVDSVLIGQRIAMTSENTQNNF